MFLELRLHADSGITNNELVASISGRRRFQLFYPDAVVPPILLNLIPLLRIFSSTCVSLSLSAIISSSLTSTVSMRKSSCLEAILGCTMVRISWSRSGRCSGFSLIFTLPLSILLLHFSLPFFLNSRLFFCNRNQHISLVIRLF